MSKFASVYTVCNLIFGESSRYPLEFSTIGSLALKNVVVFLRAIYTLGIGLGYRASQFNSKSTVIFVVVLFPSLKYTLEQPFLTFL